jgi:DNA-binding NarL/FixJ family response regulator
LPKTVLIVDDDARVRTAIRLAFEFNNRFHVCGEAIDGQDGIEKARQLKPDLIVLDLLMPLMNGIEAARILTQEMQSIPLILFTNRDAELIGPSAREAGFRAVISDQNIECLITQSQSLLESHPASD